MAQQLLSIVPTSYNPVVFVGFYLNQHPVANPGCRLHLSQNLSCLSICTSTTDTPMTGSSQGPETDFKKVADEGPIILAELPTVSISINCSSDKVASTKDINSFLRKTKLFKSSWEVVGQLTCGQALIGYVLEF